MDRLIVVCSILFLLQSCQQLPESGCDPHFEYLNAGSDRVALPETDSMHPIFRGTTFRLDSISGFQQNVISLEERACIKSLLQLIEINLYRNLAKAYDETIKDDSLRKITNNALKNEDDVYRLTSFQLNDLQAHIFLVQFNEGDEMYIARKLYLVCSQRGEVRSIVKLSQAISNTGSQAVNSITIFNDEFIYKTDLKSMNLEEGYGRNRYRCTHFQITEKGFIKIVDCVDGC